MIRKPWLSIDEWPHPTTNSRRLRRLRGRRSRVDGIQFVLPVDSQRSPALFAGFTCDAAAAARLLPHEIHPLRVSRFRSMLLVTVIDYRTTDIGSYIEYSIAVPCTHGPRPAPPLVPGALQRLFGTGQFVLDLPVSTEISVKGGKGIWGMPKHQASLDFIITDDTVSSQYDLDGELAMRVTIDRPSQFTVPIDIAAANYCTFRGMLLKSRIAFAGTLHGAFGRRARGQLLLGDHPRMDPLRTLDLASNPTVIGFLPESRGVLDDHFEGWMVSHDQLPAESGDGLESVFHLGQGQAWPDDPAGAGRLRPDGGGVG